MNELMQLFDLSRVSRGASKFDPAELDALSARTLHALPYETVRDRLEAHDIVGHKAEAFWLAVRPNLSKFLDVVEWWRIVEGEIEPQIEDADFLAAAADVLPAEPWDETTWSAWTARVRETTGRKGKTLFHPLRLGLTGLERGPELAALLPLIGSAKASARLRGRAS
jgi:glutamyl-tRNA synthetase